MKKTLLVTLEFPPDVGGVGRYLVNVARNLPIGRVVVLAAARGDKQPIDTNDSYVLYRRRLLTGRWFWPRWLPVLWQTWRIVRRERIEQLLVSHVLPVGTVAWLLRKMLPYWIIVHGVDVTTPSHPRKRALIRRVLIHARGVIVNSEFVQREVERYGVAADRITVVTPGVDLPSQERQSRATTEQKRQALEERYRLGGRPVLLTVSRLVKRKGVDTVIRAMPKIVERVPTLVYLIVGTGPEAESLQSLVAELHLEAHVLFTGFVPDDDLPLYFERSSVFVMVPRELTDRDVEGFGIVYLEANACAKPVIGSRTGGVAEAVVNGVTGLLVEPDQPDAVADAVVRLLNEPAFAQRLGIQGKTRALNTFSWKHQTGRIEALLT
ncbi:MAG: glycosyltransferase family 4 protein [Candidatus Kerfeldbacteria bacterium]|nr:glycosyltransferase family 4 protein [Candidatus Kerfeldbacteria bacterium]